MITKLVARVWGSAGIGAALLLTGCNGFFVDPNTTTTTTGSSTADYAYVVNTNGTVSEFVVGSSVLTAISGSPFTPGSPLSTASSIVVNPANAFVFVGGDGGVLSYSIGSTGALTQVSSGGVTEIGNFISMVISPNGQWLLALDNINNVVWVFAVNTSTGVLTASGSTTQLSVAAVTAPARQMAISPNGGLVAVAIGAGGDDVFTFNETTGVLTSTNAVNKPVTGYSDDSVTFDSTNGYLLIGRGLATGGTTSSILSYAVSSVGVLGAVTTYTPGQDPYSLLIDATGAYVYSANAGSGNISGFSIASGALTTLSSSPFTSQKGVESLAEDINGKYVIAASTGGTADLTLYALDALTTGQLDAVATAANGSGTEGSVAVATTHPQ